MSGTVHSHPVPLLSNILSYRVLLLRYLGSDVEMSSYSAANLTFDAETLSYAVEILSSVAELLSVGADTLRAVAEILNSAAEIVSFCSWFQILVLRS